MPFQAPVPASADVRERLSEWPLPRDLHVMAVQPPGLMAWPLPEIEARELTYHCPNTSMNGTLGPALLLPHSPRGYLTAGHVVALPPGSGVVRRKRSRFLRVTRDEWLGEVTDRVDPIETPGVASYDAAIIACHQHALRLRRQAPAASLSPFLDEDIPVRCHGGMSDTRDGFIFATLRKYGYGDRIWSNSWAMAPSGIAQHGDSGALVSSEQGIIGMLVGGSLMRDSTAFDVAYVQDMECLARDFLYPRGATLA